jgi:hypothetical protein
MKIRIGVICPSEIAFRRFLPSLKKVDSFEFAGVAVATAAEWGMSQEQFAKVHVSEMQKAQTFVDAFGGKIYNGYEALLKSEDIDAVYLPLPPALHYKWARIALENGKHALVEKPFTIELSLTEELLQMAEKSGLAVHEDYMFVYHNQLKKINEIISSGEIGKVRHYRIQFGFPRRAVNDFRYKKSMGGGSLLDAGGYTIKYASMLLGPSAKVISSSLCYEDEWNVDIFGAVTMVNDEGTIAQLSFGMDCNYKCLFEAWGSSGTLTTGRVLTAPDNFEPDVVIRKGNDDELRKLPSDEAFVKSIKRFAECIVENNTRMDNYQKIRHQSMLLEDVKIIANKRNS